MRKNIRKLCVVMLMLMLMILLFATGCGSSADDQNITEAQTTIENQTVTEDQTMDFSGEWTGIQLLAEISGEDAQNYQEMEGMTLDSRLILSLPNKSTGTAQLYFVDDLAGPALNASVGQDRLTLLGELWGDPFEWNGTFEYDDTAGEWTLTGGGDITGTDEDVVFHIVLSLNQASADTSESQPTAVSEPASQAVSADAPIEELLLGSWMKQPSNVMVERSVLTFRADGTAMTFHAKPGAGDTEDTWNTGSWEKDEPLGGTWKIEGNKLVTAFENEALSFETDVRVSDANTIVIEVFYTRSEYYRLP